MESLVDDPALAVETAGIFIKGFTVWPLTLALSRMVALVKLILKVESTLQPKLADN
jgi:hypothetical protein